MIRVVGALVPMPTEQFYHPFGLANYAVTYSGYQVLQNALQWERPLPDLAVAASGTSFTTVKEQTTITASVSNPGSATATGVAVRFTDNGTQIGSIQTIATIAAGGSWTSAPVAVEPGRTYGLAVDAAGGAAVVQQLSAVGAVVASTPLAAALIPAAAVTQVRIRLEGGLTGATFDNVWLWERLQ